MHMHIHKHGGKWKGLAEARSLLAAEGDMLLLFLMPTWVGGGKGKRNTAAAKADAKRDVSVNSEV